MTLTTASGRVTPPARSFHAAFALGVAFLVLLAGGIGSAWWMARQGVRSPVRILLITPPSEVASEMDGLHCRALGILIQDHLEYANGFAVTSMAMMPSDLGPIRRQPNTLILEVRPQRLGEDLSLSSRFVWAKQLTQGAPPPWTSRHVEAGLPFLVLDAFFKGFPRKLKALNATLIPRSSQAFWTLIQAAAWRLQNERLEEGIRLAEEVLEAEPSCASAWFLLGNLRYRRMLNAPRIFREEQAKTEAYFQRGLALAPGHPRGTLLLSLLKTDSGDTRESLDLLLQTKRKHPNSLALLTGIIYSARQSGLLALARRAMELRDALSTPLAPPQGLEITRLYTGEIELFEASLQPLAGQPRWISGVQVFYRGYLALVKGDRPLAHQAFREAAERAREYPNIQRLSGIYELILEGRQEEALKMLRESDQERIGMREPDGEFTLRLAEAYAMAGDRASAMELANRAFARGFGCKDWYERSPMLDSLKGLPKWKALMHRLQERQALMEARFPVGLLEEN